ncbi:MAG: DNA polymerase III subunit gamma/tau [Candidatus Tokpelaia sp. JSC189]|nr:MAG: DNA polymerase III subunit gamma/tau [Candidatus Tokpelaia sp. JSC189]
MNGMETKTAEKIYRVLARKYRPQDFSDLIGQEPMVRTLTNAFEADRIAQAWMLTGVRGVGKTTTARILARALNYKTDAINKPIIDLRVPGEHCQAIMEGRHIDVLEMDAASHTGIDNIREIIEQVCYCPISARYKVYIIDEIHMLSTQAFNGLLKTLEEPPPHVKFIFATTEIRKVPVTVLSRCQRFDLRRIDSATLMQHLKKISDAENIKAEEPALAMIARVGEGSVRDALSILDQAIAYGHGEVRIETVRAMLGLADKVQIIDLFGHIMNGEISVALQVFKNLYDAGADPAVIMTSLADFNHLVTRLRFTPELGEDISLSEEERLRGKAFAEKLSIRVLARCWQMLLKGIAEVENAMRPLQTAEMLLIRLTHAADLPTIDEALKVFACNPSATIMKTSPAAPLLPETAVARPMLPTALPAKGISVDKNKKKRRLESLQDIIQLADEKDDIQFKFIIKEYIRPVSFKSGYMEFVPAKEAPYDLAQQIAKTLYKWTDERWVIKAVNEGGGQTIAEEEQSKRNALLLDAETDSDVAAILASFPGSRVVDVRFNKQNDEPVSKTDIIASTPNMADED